MNEGYILPLLEHSCRRFHKSGEMAIIHTRNGNPQVRNLHRAKQKSQAGTLRSCMPPDLYTVHVYKS